MINKPTVHLLFMYYKDGKLYQSLCNLFFVDKNRVTEDSTAITCKNCLRAYLANQEKREEDESK